jgi:xanthine dehydrogenase large subunit
LKNWFEIEINGKTHRVEGERVETTLLEFLRTRGLTSVREACDGVCTGACTVVMVEEESGGHAGYRAISSCVALLPMMAGRRLLTAEGVDGRKGGRVVQDALVASGASLCGYCAPGIVMTLFEGIHRTDMKTNRSLNEQLQGNVCRCTGYRSVRAAAVRALRSGHSEGANGESGRDKPRGSVGGVYNPVLTKEKPADEGSKQSKGSLEGGPGEFQYADAQGGRFYRPRSQAELLMLIGQHPGGVLVGGGTAVGAEIRRTPEALSCIISIDGVGDLREVKEQDVFVEVGAGVSLRRIISVAGDMFPLIREVLRGHSRQNLNRATAGGLLIDAAGVNEWASVLVVLGAHARLASADGEREVSVEQLFGKKGGVRLREGEIIVAIRIPREKASGARTLAKHYRVTGGGRTVCGTFEVKLDSKKGKVTSARLVFGLEAGSPRRARQTEKALKGKAWIEESLVDVLNGLRDEIGMKDERRARLATNLFRKFYREFEEGVDEPQWSGRGDICLNAEDEILAGTGKGRASRRHS